TFDKNFKPGNVQLWDLNIQHSITNSVIAQIGYVGSKGTHLMGLFDINSALPNHFESPDTTTRPYYKQFPQFGVIAAARSNLGSIYNSLQTTLRLQSWHGLTSQLAYTWSHALEYDNSDYDVRNTFTGYFNYAIPAFRGPERLTHGWEVSSGFSFHGGTPYTVVASSNASGN